MSEKRYEIVVDHDGGSRAEVAVCMRIANHGGDVVEALDSVARQDVSQLNLVLVDDHSTDDAPQTCARWLEAQSSRFNKVAVLRHERPLGVAVSRNHGFTECGADYAFVLDASNRLFPRCLSRCREALSASGAALAYPAVEVFGARRGLSGTASDAPGPGGSRAVTGMALVDVSAWNAVGGYSEACEAGSEDAEFWSRLEGSGFHHVRVPEILGRYRARRAPWRRIGVVEAGNDRLKLGYIGQILPHKGLTVLLDAVLRLGASALGRMEVHIWGNVHSHPVWSDFNRSFFAKVERLQGIAHFHGEYGNDQLHLILGAIDALVVPSTWWENSPLTIQEAFLAGVPVLTSNVGGMKELVRDGVHGLLFEVNNSEDLAAKLVSILERPSQLEAFRENRPDEVVQRMDDHAKRLSDVYRGLLEARPWHPHPARRRSETTTPMRSGKTPARQQKRASGAGAAARPAREAAARPASRVDDRLLVPLSDEDLTFVAGLAEGGPSLDPRIHRDDAMYNFISRHPDIPDAVPAYFESGADMLEQLSGVLERVDIELTRIPSFLEFACGYGRFTRHLVRRLDKRRLTVSDVDRAAVDFQRDCFGVRGFYSSFDPDELELGEERAADVVFVASLFSHLPAQTWRRWLAKLYTAVRAGGVLVFSTHGPLCLPPGRTMPHSGFIYFGTSETEALPNQFYGTTYVTPEFVARVVEEATDGELELRMSQELWKYQDLFVVRRSSFAGARS